MGSTLVATSVDAPTARAHRDATRAATYGAYSRATAHDTDCPWIFWGGYLLKGGIGV